MHVNVNIDLFYEMKTKFASAAKRKASIKTKEDSNNSYGYTCYYKLKLKNQCCARLHNIRFGFDVIFIGLGFDFALL